MPCGELLDRAKAIFAGTDKDGSDMNKAEQFARGVSLVLDLLLIVAVFLFFFNAVYGWPSIPLWGEGMTDAMRVLTGGAGARHMTVLSDPGHEINPYFTKGNPTYEDSYAMQMDAAQAAKEGFKPGHDQPGFWASTAPRELRQAQATRAAAAAAPAAEGMYDPSNRIDRRNLTDEALLASS